MQISLIFKLAIVAVAATAAFSSLSTGLVAEEAPSNTPPPPTPLNLRGSWKIEDPGLYRVSGEATQGYKGAVVPYEMWVDGNDWEMVEPLNVHAEKSFLTKNNFIAGIIVARPDAFSLAKLQDILISSAKEGEIKNAAIVEENKRIVNGTELLSIHWKGLLNDHETDFLSYIYSGHIGTVMVHAYTPANLYEQNKAAMEKFLNGLVLLPISPATGSARTHRF